MPPVDVPLPLEKRHVYTTKTDWKFRRVTHIGATVGDVTGQFYYYGSDVSDEGPWTLIEWLDIPKGNEGIDTHRNSEGVVIGTVIQMPDVPWVFGKPLIETQMEQAALDKARREAEAAAHH